jgi:hypothetical protein
MKRILFITIAAVLAFSAIPAYAQYGNLKKAIKDKVKKEEPKTNNPTEKNTSETGINKSDSNIENPNQSNKEITFDPKYPPGILFSSLLDGFILHENGKAGFMDIKATFLPPAKGTKVAENYNEVDGGKLESVIKKADGSVHDRRFWRGVPLQNPFWNVFYTGSFIQMSPGDYTLEFLVEGKPFYRFPFSVVNEKGGDDPFAPGAKDKLTLKGAWETYGYLYLEQNNPELMLYFKTWIRAPYQKSVESRAEIFRDGKLIAEHESSPTIQVKWQTESISFRKPGNGSQVIGADIFGKDGDYKVVLKYDGSVYGEYPFSIKGGKFVYLPEQTRGEADFMTMIEGGNNSWYVKRKAPKP